MCIDFKIQHIPDSRINSMIARECRSKCMVCHIQPTKCANGISKGEKQRKRKFKQLTTNQAVVSRRQNHRRRKFSAFPYTQIRQCQQQHNFTLFFPRSLSFHLRSHRVRSVSNNKNKIQHRIMYLNDTVLKFSYVTIKGSFWHSV